MILAGFFAPAPPGIAVNPETRECGYYWMGDEYATYVLPAPWKVLRAQDFKDVDGRVLWDGRPDHIAEFCEKIGYRYNDANIGETYGQSQWTSISYVTFIVNYSPWICGGLLLLAGLIVVARRLDRFYDDKVNPERKTKKASPSRKYPW